MEIHYALLREHGEKAADEGYSASSRFLCEFDEFLRVSVQGSDLSRPTFPKQQRG